jgi:hypothetical protein
MPLIDHYVPMPHFRERHALDVEASKAAILDAVRSYRTPSDPFFRAMIGLRELPARIGRRLSHRRPERDRSFGLEDFTLLEENDEEIVYGLAGRFWRLDFGLTPLTSGTDFLGLHDPGIAKLALNFTVRPKGRGLFQLSTETRVFCVDADARARFTPYWYLVRPISGLIRRRTLASVRAASENRSHWDINSSV